MAVLNAKSAALSRLKQSLDEILRASDPFNAARTDATVVAKLARKVSKEVTAAIPQELQQRVPVPLSADATASSIGVPAHQRLIPATLWALRRAAKTGHCQQVFVVALRIQQWVQSLAATAKQIHVEGSVNVKVELRPDDNPHGLHAAFAYDRQIGAAFVQQILSQPREQDTISLCLQQHHDKVCLGAVLISINGRSMVGLPQETIQNAVLQVRTDREKIQELVFTERTVPYELSKTQLPHEPVVREPKRIHSASLPRRSTINRFKAIKAPKKCEILRRNSEPRTKSYSSRAHLKRQATKARRRSTNKFHTLQYADAGSHI